MKMHSIKRNITVRVLIGMFVLYSTAMLLSAVSIHQWLDSKFEESLLGKASVLKAMLEQNADLLSFFEDFEAEYDTEDDLNSEYRKEQDEVQRILTDYALLWQETVPYLEKSMPEYAKNNNIDYYQIWFKSGRTLSRSSSLKQNNLTRINSTLSQPLFFDVELPTGDLGKAIQISFSPVIDGLSPDNLQPLATEKITLVLAQNPQYMQIIKNTVSYILIASLVFLLLASWWIIRYALFKGMSPLRELNSQLQDIQADNFDKRIKLSHSVAELDSVQNQLNQLLARLAASYKRERLFSSNVAHELRTPICEVRNIAEVALSLPSTSQDDFDAYNDVRQASIQMQEIVDNLLALARLERPDALVSNTKTNLSELVTAITERYGEAFTAKQLHLNNQLPQDTYCLTSKTELELIFINLIENAINYSPADSQITLALQQQHDSLAITCSNIALNLEQRDLPLMCDRLWRKDASRTGASNSGIGLSLVNAYATFLNLNIQFRLNEQQLFTVELSGIKQS